jgi:hypothetical protein
MKLRNTGTIQAALLHYTQDTYVQKGLKRLGRMQSGGSVTSRQRGELKRLMKACAKTDKWRDACAELLQDTVRLMDMVERDWRVRPLIAFHTAQTAIKVLSHRHPGRHVDWPRRNLIMRLIDLYAETAAPKKDGWPQVGIARDGAFMNWLSFQPMVPDEIRDAEMAIFRALEDWKKACAVIEDEKPHESI